MDTDDLTIKAWDVIVRAARVPDTVKAELGAMARQLRSGDEWLQGVHAHLKEIADSPAEYVDTWDLENAQSVTPARIRICPAELCNRVDKVLAMPMNRRGARQW